MPQQVPMATVPTGLIATQTLAKETTEGFSHDLAAALRGDSGRITNIGHSP